MYYYNLKLEWENDTFKVIYAENKYEIPINKETFVLAKKNGRVTYIYIYT